MTDILLALIGLIFVIVTCVAPIIALFFRLVKKTPFKKMWVLSSIIVTGFVSLIMITAFVANFFEDKSFVKKMDAAYEEMEKDDLPEADSIEKILAKIHKTGSYNRRRRSKTSSPSVNAVFKNYNDTDFKGTLTIHAYHNDEEIGKIEIELELSKNAYDSKYIEPNKLNIHKDIWSDVTFDYEIEGEFEV